MDDQGPGGAGRVLGAIMAVIPASAVEIGAEEVAEAAPRGDGTLRDTRDAILIRSVLLQDAVPVERCAFVV